MQPITIYIAASYLHYDMKQFLLKDIDALPSVAFYSFDSFLAQYAFFDDPLPQILQVYKALQDIEVVLLKDMLKSTMFIEELMQVMDRLLGNGIKIEDLSFTYAHHQELLVLLKRMLPIYASSRTTAKQAMSLLLKESLSHICLVNFVPSNAEEQCFLETARQKGIQELQLYVPVSDKQYYVAVNMRQETEACAQQIVSLYKSGTALRNIKVMVGDSAAYGIHIKQVFQRYQIPYDAYFDTNIPPVLAVFKNLLTWYASPNLKNELALADACLSIQETVALHRYCAALHVHTLLAPLPSLDSLQEGPFMNRQTLQELRFAQASVLRAHEKVLHLFTVLDTSTIAALLPTWYDYVIAHMSINEADTQFLSALPQRIIPLLDLLEGLPKNEACQFLIQHMSSLHSLSERRLNTVCISDLTHPHTPCTYGFVLGLHQNAYPAFHPCTGLLDELLINHIDGYEPLAVRYHRHIEKMKHNLLFASHMYYSYPQGNFEGKAFESSLDLELQMSLDAPIPYPLAERHSVHTKAHTLSIPIAKELFFPAHSLITSSSRLERYFACPYAYFLQSGLQLQAPKEMTVGAIEIGNLQHAFFESVINTYGKQYAVEGITDIQAFLENALLESPAYTIEHHLDIKDMLSKAWESTLLTLQDMEAHTAFAPTQCEYRFHQTVYEKDGYAIILRGIIDRLDEVTHGFRIIDYKSGNRSLSMRAFLSGTSLQLPAYTAIMVKNLQKQPFGAYYYTLRQDVHLQEAYQLTRRPAAVEEVEEAAFLACMKPNKLQGATFVDDSSNLGLLDDSGSYVQTLRFNKNDILTVKKVEYTEWEQALEALYALFLASLLEGSIALDPCEGACEYCSYRMICHFKGKVAKIKPRVGQCEEEEAQ